MPPALQLALPEEEDVTKVLNLENVNMVGFLSFGEIK